MTYDLTITFRVGDIDNQKDAHDTAANLAEHVLDTFNDDESISPEVGIKITKVTK